MWTLEEEEDNFPSKDETNGTMPNAQCRGIPQQWARYVALGATSSISLCGTVLNLLALIVLIQQARTKPSRRLVKFSPDMMLLVNLIIVDFLYCTVSLPLLALFYVWNGELPPLACAMSGWLRYILNSAEVITITLVAVQRCRGVLRGGSGGGGRAWSRSQAGLTFAGIWIYSALSQSGFVSALHIGFNQCVYRCGYLSMGWIRLGAYTTEGILPLCLTTASYCCLLRRVLSPQFASQPVTSSVKEQRKVCRRNHRAARFLYRHILLYPLCVLPICLYNMLNSAGGSKELGILLSLPYWSLFIINTAMLMYDNRRYRTAFLCFLSRQPCKLKLQGRIKFASAAVLFRLKKNSVGNDMDCTSCQCRDFGGNEGKCSKTPNVIFAVLSSVLPPLRLGMVVGDGGSTSLGTRSATTTSLDNTTTTTPPSTPTSTTTLPTTATATPPSTPTSATPPTPPSTPTSITPLALTPTTTTPAPSTATSTTPLPTTVTASPTSISTSAAPFTATPTTTLLTATTPPPSTPASAAPLSTTSTTPLPFTTTITPFSTTPSSAPLPTTATTTPLHTTATTTPLPAISTTPFLTTSTTVPHPTVSTTVSLTATKTPHSTTHSSTTIHATAATTLPTTVTIITIPANSETEDVERNEAAV